MAFEDVAKKVIKRSIRSAVCIDDQYASSYSQEEGLEFDEPTKLYNSFREVGRCDLDIYQFQNLEESWKTDYMLHNKDLMILDWELDAGGGSDSTLKILKDVIDSNRIPFILVYTSTEDLHLIARSLLENFNYITTEKIEVIFESIDHKFGFVSENGEAIDSEIFFEDHKSSLLEYILHYDKRIQLLSDIVKKINNDFSIKKEHQAKSKKNLLNICQNIVGKTEDAFLDFSIGIFNIENNESKYPTTRIEVEPLAFKINGTSIIVYHKEKEQAGIKPEDLFNEFANAVINNPHNFLTLLSLEFKDNLREDFPLIGSDFSQIDEKAFFHHLTNYRDNEDEEFDLKNIYNFILKSWINELHHQKMDIESEVLNHVPDRYQTLENEIDISEEEDNPTVKELVRYSAFISTAKTQNRVNKNLRFGDIFQNKDKEKEFFLCITPACTCLRPSKIKNNFYFVWGFQEGDFQALKNAESGFYSFVTIDREPISIRWRCKPFTSYIEVNNINSLYLQFSGETKELDHIAYLKENYAQRISNQSFSYGYKVGIDLPHVNKEE